MEKLFGNISPFCRLLCESAPLVEFNAPFRNHITTIKSIEYQQIANSPVELGLNIAQNGTEINNISLEAEFHPY